MCIRDRCGGGRLCGRLSLSGCFVRLDTAVLRGGLALAGNLVQFIEPGLSLIHISPAPPLTDEQKKEFIELTTRLKLLSDRRALLLARTGDEYLTDPPKPPAKP